MILANTEGHGYASYSPTYVSMGYKLPTTQIYLTESWLKDLNLDVVEIIKRMMIKTDPLYMLPTNYSGLTSIIATTRIFVRILLCHCTH